MKNNPNKRRKSTTYVFVDASNIIYRNSDNDPWKIDLIKNQNPKWHDLYEHIL